MILQVGRPHVLGNLSQILNLNVSAILGILTIHYLLGWPTTFAMTTKPGLRTQWWERHGRPRESEPTPRRNGTFKGVATGMSWLEFIGSMVGNWVRIHLFKGVGFTETSYAVAQCLKLLTCWLKRGGWEKILMEMMKKKNTAKWRVPDWGVAAAKSVVRGLRGTSWWIRFDKWPAHTSSLILWTTNFKFLTSPLTRFWM